jgi:hypothetical protein
MHAIKNVNVNDAPPGWHAHSLGPGSVFRRRHHVFAFVRFRHQVTKGSLRKQLIHYGTRTAVTFQMSSQYSVIARSEENFPLRAVLRMDIRVQASTSCQAALTRP